MCCLYSWDVWSYNIHQQVNRVNNNGLLSDRWVACYVYVNLSWCWFRKQLRIIFVIFRFMASVSSYYTVIQDIRCWLSCVARDLYFGYRKSLVIKILHQALMPSDLASFPYPFSCLSSFQIVLLMQVLLYFFSHHMPLGSEFSVRLFFCSWHFHHSLIKQMHRLLMFKFISA